MPDSPDASENKTMELTHLDAQGNARMVDVGHKPPLKRRAVAEGFFVAAVSTLDRLMSAPGAAPLPKASGGEALSVARIAGIQAAKRTDDWIPLCHSLPIDAVQVDFERVDETRVRVTGTATVTAKTGVEMEALVAVSAACLTLYDMTKAVDKQLRIEGITLVEKTKLPVV